jgi:hypothetical protein
MTELRASAAMLLVPSLAMAETPSPDQHVSKKAGVTSR